MADRIATDKTGEYRDVYHRGWPHSLNHESVGARANSPKAIGLLNGLAACLMLLSWKEQIDDISCD
jgi:hypothetical protein